MEKYAPHCKLALVQVLANAGNIRTTRSARDGALAIGLDFDGMVEVVKSLTPSDFYKSMTSHVDHRIWQDVYRPYTSRGHIYLKLTIIDEVLIVSFKEL